MEEIEVPTEHLQEEIHHHATHSNGQSKWVMGVALSSAVFAALAAIAALMAGHHSNEAMIEQVQAANQWAYYQAKGVKATVLASKMDLLKELGKSIATHDEEKLSEYKKEQEEIKKVAEGKEASSREHLARHIPLARGVTFFQIAIAMAAISVLTQRKKFWFLSLGLGICGIVFMIIGFF